MVIQTKLQLMFVKVYEPTQSSHLNVVLYNLLIYYDFELHRGTCIILQTLRCSKQ